MRLCVACVEHRAQSSHQYSLGLGRSLFAHGFEEGVTQNRTNSFCQAAGRAGGKVPWSRTPSPGDGQAGPRPGGPRSELRDPLRQAAIASRVRSAGPARRLASQPVRGSSTAPKTVLCVWVLPLWEAFLVQMNDFERYLESGLRQMLDRVVASRPPRRRRRTGPGLPLPAVEQVGVPVQPIHLLP